MSTFWLHEYCGSSADAARSMAAADRTIVLEITSHLS
jgi:hypothetical protein